MINKYCYKCGTAMYGNKHCKSCGAVAIEVPSSMGQLETEERIKQIQAEHKPKKGAGCIVMLIVAFVMFGIPAIFMFLGAGVISYGIVTIAVLFLNYKIYHYRKNMSFKKKNKYFKLTKKTKKDIMDREKLCQNCRQLLTEGMSFCPKCSASAGEDIPINLGLKSKRLAPIIKNEPVESEPDLEVRVEVKNEEKINENIDKEIVESLSIACANCGADVTGKKFCVECGTKVQIVPEDMCKNCGANVKDKKFCTECGLKAEVR